MKYLSSSTNEVLFNSYQFAPSLLDGLEVHLNYLLEQVVGIEPTSSAWKAEVIAIIRYLHSAPLSPKAAAHFLPHA